MSTSTSLEVIHSRGGLQRTLHSLQAGKLTIGFLGGSITDARPGHNWPEPVISWFQQQFPQARISVENAGIGATGSDLAVFRVERDIIQRGCNLVFVEYAVNDPAPSETTRRSREGLIRKLLATGACDVVLVYTFQQSMYHDMSQGKVPGSIAEFETLAEHYHLPSVWMGLHALWEVKSGAMRWEEWLPDGLHPQARGSLSYGQSVTQLLERELLSAPTEQTIPVGEELPAPLTPQNWQHTTNFPFADVHLAGPWTIRRWPHLVWIDQVLWTAAIGARLSFAFEGRGLVLGFDFGKSSAEFTYRIDAGEWKTMVRDRPVWCGESGWYRPILLTDELPDGKHSFELEVIHGDRAECTGTNFALALIGIIH